jgi:hypothetical protein
MIIGGCFQMISRILAVVFVLMWVHRAYRAAQRLTSVRMAYTPGWAVGWWFIPFANLVQPYNIMKELWLAAKTQDSTVDWHGALASGKITAWWLLFIFTGLLQWLASVFVNPKLALPAVAAIICEGLAACTVIGAGILCNQLVTEITASLEARGAKLMLPGVPETSLQE